MDILSQIEKLLTTNSIPTFNHLKQTHALIITHSLHHSNHHISLLIRQCTQHRAPLTYARPLFDSVAHPNVLLFTSMLKFYSQLTLGRDTQRDVFTLFRNMRAQYDLKMDAFVYPMLIKLAGKEGNVVHGHVLKLGFDGDLYVRNAVMDMYGKNGCIELSRRVFDEMPERAVADWNSMVSGYWKCGYRDEAVRLFELMPNKNVVSWTAMVNGCAKCGELETARKYFDEMPETEKGVVSWNAMISGYAQKGFAELAIELFEKMVESGVKPDETTWVAVISSCSERGDPHLVKALLGSLGRKNINLNSFVKTALLDMHAKCGDLQTAVNIFEDMGTQRNVVSWNAMISAYTRIGDITSARKLFDEMPARNVVSWNSMIAGYAQNGHSALAVELFKEMMVTKDVKPDEVTMVSVISACGHLGALELGKWVTSFIDKNHIKLSISGYNSLISMYSRCGSMNDAKRIFHEMQARDVISYNKRNIFEDMGTQRNVVSWNAMISAYTRIGDITSARKLFDEMPARNVVSWNSMIAGYAQNGHSALAVELFKEMMVTKDVKPDEVTMVSVISACGHLGALELGKWVTSFIDKNHIKLSISGYNSLISMYSRCGSMNDAKRIFHEMQARDVISYNSLIAGYASQGYGTEAIELMLKMKEEAIEPDRITYIGVLTACSHAGLVKEGQQVFASIKTPSVDHYSCMVDLLGRVGKLDEAKALVDEMPMMPHAGVYGALLSASRIYKQVEVGEHAAYKLFELEPENSGNYALLSNIYATVGRYKDASRIMETMNVRGVKKTIGCSWVEYDGRVYQFIAGDQSHPRLPEIHKVLEELRKKMRTLGYLVDKNFVLRDVEEEEKEEMVGTHSEKLAIGFALIVSASGAVIRVMKNLRVCGDCHTAIKVISKLTTREIIVRDNNRFHCFKDGKCSCLDYW